MSPMDALIHIAKELASYHTDNRRPSKDELWALYSVAIAGLGVTDMTVTPEKEAKDAMVQFIDMSK